VVKQDKAKQQSGRNEAKLIDLPELFQNFFSPGGCCFTDSGNSVNRLFSHWSLPAVSPPFLFLNI